MTCRSLALVGAAGGVGSTRLAVEAGAALAADGTDAIVLDAALDTQGLAAYVPGRLEPDVTKVYLGKTALQEALVDHPAATSGTLSLAPAHAPFTRLAEAQSVEAARRVSDVIADATDIADYVIVDVSRIASNIAVGAVTAVDRVGVVTVPTDRGRDALSRCRGRLADVDAPPDLVVGNRIEERQFADADVRIPETRVTDIPETPTVLRGDDGFGPGVGTLVELGFQTSLSVSLDSNLLGSAREYLS